MFVEFYTTLLLYIFFSSFYKLWVYALNMSNTEVTMKNVYHVNFLSNMCSPPFQLPVGKINHIYETFYLFLFCIGCHGLIPVDN